MACGLPIIISDVPGGVDILGSEDALPGMVVPVGDSAALANALVKLLTDPVACEHFSGRALNRARDFSVEDIGGVLGWPSCRFKNAYEVVEIAPACERSCLKT